MNAYYAGLPSDVTMKEHCHSNPNQGLLWQSCLLQSVLGLAFFLLCSAQAILAECFSFVMGRGHWNGNMEILQDWLFSTLSFTFTSALVLVGLAIFVRFYLRSQFGPSSYYSELQADLPIESVMSVSRAFIQNNSLEKTLQIDEACGRVLGLICESSLSSTFVEITMMEMEPGRTWIGVRCASIVYGKAAMLSAFYNDQGAARNVGSQVIDMFAPYASRKRRPFQNAKASQQALPVIKLVDDCPPPFSPAGLKHFRSAGRRY